MADDWKQSVIDAVKTNDASKLDTLLKNTNEERRYLDFKIGKVSPLTCAIGKGQIDMVEQLLHAGASVEFPGPFNRTPLMEAAYHENTDICSLLLKHGANINVNSKNKHNWQPLDIAIFLGDVKTTAVLLDNGADIYDPTKPTDQLESSFIFISICSRPPGFITLVLDHCYKKDIRLSLDLLLRMCIQFCNEKSAIAMLQHGYFPHQRLSYYIKYDTYLSFHKFVRAVRRVMGFLIELNPWFLQEEWLKDEYIPMVRDHNPDLFPGWLNEGNNHQTWLSCVNQPF